MELRERWISLIHAAATGTRNVRTILTPIGLLVFAVFTGAFVFMGVWVDRLMQLPGIPDVVQIPAAVVALVFGASVTGWSAFHFLKVNGTPVPLNPPQQVVDTGPYRYARNPMLTGVFFLLFGIGLAIDSLSLVVGFTPLYIAANVWELKNIEEPELIRRLGAEYVAYRDRTPMFLPRLPRSASSRVAR